MKIKFLSTSILSLFLLFPGVSKGQDIAMLAPTSSKTKSAFSTTWQKKPFSEGWYLSFGGGVQFLDTKNAGEHKFKDRLSFAPSFTVGKYFSPIWGLRANLTGLTLNSYDALDTKRQLRYMSFNTAFTFDLFTLFGNYNPRRVFDLAPFIGASYFHVYNHDDIASNDGLAVNAGLQAKFHIAPQFDLFLEGTGMFFPSDFDGIANNSSVNVIQLAAGFTYKIGNHCWQSIEPVDLSYLKSLNDQVNTLRERLENLQVPECPECPEEKRPINVLPNLKADGPTAPTLRPQVGTKPPEAFVLQEPVFFRINKSVIDNSEIERIEKAVQYLAENPNTNVEVTGYADKNTGTAKRNLQLSKERSEAVAKMLEVKYKIDPSRISVNYKGDGIQPFIQNNDWNRAVIFLIKPKF